MYIMSEVIALGNEYPETSVTVKAPEASRYTRFMARVAAYRESPIRGQSPEEALGSQLVGVGDYLAPTYPTDLQTAESWAIEEFVIPATPARRAKPPVQTTEQV